MSLSSVTLLPSRSRGGLALPWNLGPAVVVSETLAAVLRRAIMCGLSREEAEELGQPQDPRLQTKAVGKAGQEHTRARHHFICRRNWQRARTSPDKLTYGTCAAKLLGGGRVGRSTLAVS